MKKIFLISAIFVCTLNSCNDKKVEESKTDEIVKNVETTEVNSISNQGNLQIDFLKELQEICVEDDGVFKNCDELFTKDGSSLFFIIIPKMGAKNWFENQTKNLNGEIYEINNRLTDKLTNIKKENLSKEFDVWVFYTDKKYTEFVGLNSPYNFKTPRVVELYYLKSGKNDWQIIDTYKVKNDKYDEKEIEWRNAFIDKVITESNKKETTLTSNINLISSKWTGKYSAYFSYGKIGEDNAGWLLEIEIKDNLIKARGDGYQISFEDLLSGTENNNELILNHLKNVSGYKLGEKMSPEFLITENNGEYFVKSKWVDSDIITVSKKIGYLIDKE
jgi:hypothetical protein